MVAQGFSTMFSICAHDSHMKKHIHSVKRSELALAAAQRKSASVVGNWRGPGGPQRWIQKRLQRSSERFSNVHPGDRKNEEIEETMILLSSLSNITRVVQQVSAERLSAELANPGSPVTRVPSKNVWKRSTESSTKVNSCCNSPCCTSMDFCLPSKLREVSIAATCPTRRMASPKQLTKPHHSKKS